MRVGIIGLGAIANLHARAYKNIGYPITVCHTHNREAGRLFAAEHGATFVETYEEVCRHPEVDFVDVCTFPDFRLQPLEICAENGQAHPGAEADVDSLSTARQMIETARAARHPAWRGQPAPVRRLPACSCAQAIDGRRLGKLLQADAT